MTKGFAHKKSLGQHFLTSDYVPKLMCDAAKVSEGEVVVEIGPGTGILTKEILSRGANVIAIETDERAIVELEKTFTKEIESEKLIIIAADARTLSVASLPIAAGEYKVVANIPYYISGLLFRTFLDSQCQPSDLVFLVQKELAERIAREKKSSLLSLSVAAFGTTSYVRTIKRGHFTPPPNVDSAIIAVTDISNEYFDRFSREVFFTTIKAGFAQKRKQLAPNLKNLYEPAKTKQALEALGLPSTSRAEDLDITEWAKLLNHLQSTRN